ncbi:glycosyltransferase [Frankia sp. CiP1_Cm_nod1]|uniref:glycosyltransferase n=1 Tax=Frankia sp. CiP1_Cm_nod1 TaxID=2897160 RepID=UPI002024C8BF
MDVTTGFGTTGTPPPADDGPVLVDCAGARMGGALRFLLELDGHLARVERPNVRVIGRDRPITATWLARRERLGRFARVISLNNVGFAATAGSRYVLLRNPLHFLRPAELELIGTRLDSRMARQTRIVRQAARRADFVVVPAASMAERVLDAVPDLVSRLTVRPHPLSMPQAAPAQPREPHLLLCPVLFSPWKAMATLLRLVDQAVTTLAAETGADLRVVVTATREEATADGLGPTGHLDFVGRLTPQELTHHQNRCRALIYPTRIESFGYPLAEARLAALPVVARNIAHNRDIAGPVLVPYQWEEPAEIAAAIHRALNTTFVPEPVNPFDPDRYFNWLLGAPEKAA